MEYLQGALGVLALCCLWHLWHSEQCKKPKTRSECQLSFLWFIFSLPRCEVVWNDFLAAGFLRHVSAFLFTLSHNKYEDLSRNLVYTPMLNSAVIQN